MPEETQVPSLSLPTLLSEILYYKHSLLKLPKGYAKQYFSLEHSNASIYPYYKHISEIALRPTLSGIAESRSTHEYLPGNTSLAQLPGEH